MSTPCYGDLPERWETHKTSELFVERCDKVSDADFAPLSVSKGGIVPQIATVAKSNAGDNRKLVKNVDFVINSRSGRRGSSGVSVSDGSVSLINIVLTPRIENNEKYWHYLFKSHNFIKEYYRNGKGIVSDLWTTRIEEMWFSPDEKQQYKVENGDLLIVEGGAGAGGSYIFDYYTEDEFYNQNSIQIIRSKGSSLNRFLYYYMYSLVKRGYIDCVCEKATIPHFTKERLLNTLIPVIPLPKQEVIVARLDQQCEHLDKIISKLNDEIALLAEYRTRLISDVVTGKLDVRGVKVPDYETIEDVVDAVTDESEGDVNITEGEA